jgi:RsmE family RNA methyltransferase
MNLILLDPSEKEGSFSPEDRRYSHLRAVLKAKEGDHFRAGIVNGPLGHLKVLRITQDKIAYHFSPEKEPPPPYPLEIILGAVRPLVARRLLKDLTSLGVRAIHMVSTDLSEKSYLESSLWKKNEYIKNLREGAEQAETTLLPVLCQYKKLDRCLSGFSLPIRKIVLDPTAEQLFWRQLESEQETRDLINPVALAVGPERGWSERERNLFHEAGFHFRRLGTRILRTEAAALIAAGICVVRWFEGQ